MIRERFLRSDPTVSRKERLVNSFREFRAREYSFNLLLGLIIGVIGGYGAVGFRAAIHQVEFVLFGSDHPTYQYFLSLPWYWLLIVPVIGGLIVGPIVTFFAREAKGHGVPEVMAAVATRGGVIRGRVAAAKVISSAVTIGSGGSAGSEGPIVQIGSSLASAIGQLLRVSPAKMKTFVGCGAAAGIAATFNAPVAGMLFALEIILGEFTVAHISPIIVASVTATAISRAHLGDAPAFEVPGYALVSPVELIHYALLGLVAAVVAVGFAKSLTASENLFEKLRIPDMLKPALGGLIIGILGAAGLPHVYGVGYEFIEEALRGQLPFYLLAGLILAKITATSATLGSGGSGGIFAPSLFLGAMTGGVVWYFGQLFTPDLMAPNYGPYALVGMAAVVASTTRAPLQAILILFELTGGYEVILPLMLSSIIAVLVGSGMMTESIYTIKLKAKGINLRRGTEVNVLKGIHTSEVLRSDFRAVPASMRLRPLLNLISDSTAHSTIFVLDAEEKLMGYISFQELRRVFFDVESLEPILVAADIANLTPVAVNPTDSLDLVIRLFARQSLDELPVVDPANPGKIVGSIHRNDVVEVYNNEILKRDLMGGMTSTLNVTNRVQASPIAPGYSMAEVELPVAYAGKDLRTLDLRNQAGIEVMLVRRRHPDDLGRVESIVPSPDLVLQAGDIMLVSGPQKAVERLARR